MIKRQLSADILCAAAQLPVIAITGPRQSGKTTLVKSLFKSKPYVNFENLDDRRLAKEDPRGFLNQFQLSPLDRTRSSIIEQGLGG